MRLSEFEYPDFYIENAARQNAVLRRQMHRILLEFVKNSLCFNMRNCRDIRNIIDGHTQHFTFELPKMTVTLHFKKSTVVFKELILT